MSTADGPNPAADLPEELQALIKPELEPGERLLWAAESTGRASVTDLNPVLLGAWAAGFGVVAAFSFAGLNGAFGSQLQPAQPLLAWIAVIASITGFIIGMVTAWSLSESVRSRLSPIRRTVQALTDRRAIIWTPGPNRKGVEVRSIFPANVRDITRVEYPNGSGSVTIQHTNPICPGPNGFQEIPDVRRVEKLARRVLLADGPRTDEDFRRSSGADEPMM